MNRRRREYRSAPTVEGWGSPAINHALSSGVPRERCAMRRRGCGGRRARPLRDLHRIAGEQRTETVDSIPVADGNAWSSIVLTRREAEAATWGERNGFVVVDQRVRRLVLLWFFWCEARNRPSIIVNRRKGDRAVVTLDLYCTDRCLTRAGWKAVVDVYERHGSLAMRRVQRKGFVFPDYVFGPVAWPVADRLARELLAITNAGSLVRVCDRAPEGAARR